MTLGCQPTRVKEGDQLHFSHIFHSLEYCSASCGSAVSFISWLSFVADTIIEYGIHHYACNAKHESA
jgi:hypothetical protein